MTSTRTVPRPPKRWPVHTEVIDSPACAMAQYADYRRAYHLVSGSLCATSADTLDEILAKGEVWARESSRIVRVPMIPHYDAIDSDEKYARPVGSAPWAGGTWQGRCGATLWVRDTDHHYRDAFATLRALSARTNYMQDGPLATYNVSTLQAWWVNGNAARYPALDGFHVECQQVSKEHGPRCTALDIEWDWRDYAPWTDQGANTQLSLF